MVFSFFNTQAETWLWMLFAGLIGSFLILDLGLLNRVPKKISVKSASIQTMFWVVISIIFGLLIYLNYDPPGNLSSQDASMQFFTAYITEYALSVDNIFVIIIILRFFNVHEEYHHTVLFWGILGALIMRGLFIFIGAWLIGLFHWILYLFGLFLIITGIKMLFLKEEDDYNLDDNVVLKFARKYLNFTANYEGSKFYIKKNGILYFTPLFLVLLLIESTDLIFALDSIPAAFAITQDKVVLYTSNIFAIMGLRAMFFMLAGILDKFYLLKKALSLVLIFIGLKMFMEIFDQIGSSFESLSFLKNLYFHIPTHISLAVIATLLFGSILVSLIRKPSQVEE